MESRSEMGFRSQTCFEIVSKADCAKAPPLDSEPQTPNPKHLLLSHHSRVQTLNHWRPLTQLKAPSSISPPQVTFSLSSHFLTHVTFSLSGGRSAGWQEGQGRWGGGAPSRSARAPRSSRWSSSVRLEICLECLEMPRMFEGYVSNFAARKAPKFIVQGKLTFDERFQRFWPWLELFSVQTK